MAATTPKREHFRTATWHVIECVCRVRVSERSWEATQRRFDEHVAKHAPDSGSPREADRG